MAAPCRAPISWRELSWEEAIRRVVGHTPGSEALSPTVWPPCWYHTELTPQNTFYIIFARQKLIPLLLIIIFSARLENLHVLGVLNRLTICEEINPFFVTSIFRFFFSFPTIMLLNISWVPSNCTGVKCTCSLSRDFKWTGHKITYYVIITLRQATWSRIRD